MVIVGPFQQNCSILFCSVLIYFASRIDLQPVRGFVDRVPLATPTRLCCWPSPLVAAHHGHDLGAVTVCSGCGVWEKACTGAAAGLPLAGRGGERSEGWAVPQLMPLILSSCRWWGHVALGTGEKQGDRDAVSCPGQVAEGDARDGSKASIPALCPRGYGPPGAGLGAPCWNTSIPAVWRIVTCSLSPPAPPPPAFSRRCWRSAPLPAHRPVVATQRPGPEAPRDGAGRTQRRCRALS